MELFLVGAVLGYIYHKLNESYGSGIIFGYFTGHVWHVYNIAGTFYVEQVSVTVNTTF